MEWGMDIDTSLDSLDFALAAIKSNIAKLEVLNFEDIVAPKKVASVCEALARRGIGEITISADDGCGVGSMAAEFYKNGFTEISMVEIELKGKKVFAFCLKK